MFSNIKNLVAALALAAFATGPALADTCDLTDGFAIEPVAFNSEAEACLESPHGAKHRSILEGQIRQISTTTRNLSGVSRLESLASLNEAARLHAYDMAARGYAAHLDKEGRDHSDRVRLLDRQRLMGAFGANVVVVDANQTAESIFEAMMKDPQNANNISRSAFSHMGVGAAEADGKVYLVQLFARVDGALVEAVPIHADRRIELGAKFLDERLQPLRWRVESASGKTIAEGKGIQISKLPRSRETAFLSMDVSYKNDVYTLRGPAISVQ